MSTTPKEAHAQALGQMARDLGATLQEKAVAYGAAHMVQPALWALLLGEYRTDDDTYELPPHAVARIPRLTRVLDRVLRIVNAPAAGDRMGEDPWLDLAGDALAGAQAEEAQAGPRRDVDMSTGMRYTVRGTVHDEGGAMSFGQTLPSDNDPVCAECGEIIAPGQVFLADRSPPVHAACRPEAREGRCDDCGGEFTPDDPAYRLIGRERRRIHRSCHYAKEEATHG